MLSLQSALYSHVGLTYSKRIDQLEKYQSLLQSFIVSLRTEPNPSTSTSNNNFSPNLFASPSPLVIILLQPSFF